MKLVTENIGRMIASSNGLERALLSPGEDSFRIIYYHLAAPSLPPYYFESKFITPEILREQIRHFKKKYKFISLYEALDKLSRGESLKGLMAVTTDDGFAENYHYIAPILLEEKVTATFFLIDNCIDNKTLMWRNKLIYLQHERGIPEALKIAEKFSKQHGIPAPEEKENLLSWSSRTWGMPQKDAWAKELWDLANLEPIEEFLDHYKPYLTVPQIRSLMAEGFDMGSHSKTHPEFEKLSVDEAEQEILGSLHGISQKIGKKIDLFAYPFSRRALKPVEDEVIGRHSGEFKTLLGIKSGLNNFNNPYQWERDGLEFPYHSALFRFSLLPLLRRYVLSPMNIKR